MGEVSTYRRPTNRAASPELKALYANECQRCGMCCIYYSEAKFCIPIVGPPYQQPPRKFIQIGPRAKGLNTSNYLRNKPDDVWKKHRRCAALVGIQGVKVECGIYSSRPYACSDYDPGSPDCIRVRKWARLEPLDDGYGRS